MIPTIREKYRESIGNGASGGAIAAQSAKKVNALHGAFPYRR
jgi:acetyl-CoA carboxylase alpha subunit